MRPMDSASWGQDVASTAVAVRPYAPVASHSAAQLTAALTQSAGNKSRAAQLLGLTPRQFSYRWEKLGLE